MNPAIYDVAIIGGGIVGVAAALALTRHRHASLIVIEAEDRLAAHQSGHNSGVIHSGVYYKPGSQKALNCIAGREALYRFCADHGIRHERSGKLIIATQAAELPALEELYRRGIANGLVGIKRLHREEIRAYEPHAEGIAGVHVAETGVVDYREVTEACARQFRQAGGTIATRSRLLACTRRTDELILETMSGPLHCRALINCAGLWSDRVAHLCGVEPHVQIIPFRGEYYELIPKCRDLVRHIVYPVPDSRFPFLGVHLTRTIDGRVEAGPNAVLAFRRAGYRRSSFSWNDCADMAHYAGFWRLAGRYWRIAGIELLRSLSKRAFVDDLRRLVPDLRSADLRPAGSGVRAQAVDRLGNLLDDFRIVEAERMIHVLNAPSPAATASLSIGQNIARRAAANFDLKD
jgi:L-2-hydroxyglutarate oxidase